MRHTRRFALRVSGFGIVLRRIASLEIMLRLRFERSCRGSVFIPILFILSIFHTWNNALNAGLHDMSS